MSAIVFAWTPVALGAEVVTYHYDTLRTGWNQAETILTPASVGSGSFGLLAQTQLDEQVDAQPLFAAGQTISGQGTHDVVYVATENNSVYAIDAHSGAVLVRQNYGPPVPITALPDGCNNNSNNIGITATPVIDSNLGLLYAITYTYESNRPTYRVHAISLSTLQDTVSPPVITGTGVYKNGQPANFIASTARQRAGLLEANGNIYAGFGSFCDLAAQASRGWVLGFNAKTLAPLPISTLLNRKPRSGDDYFLTSIWMSGYGIAADATGSLYFASGNSDYDGKSYNSTYNLSESVINLSADLSKVQQFFTPKDGDDGWSNLDKSDGDFGAAGVLLLPDQPGAYPHLAVAAGKLGPLYLLDRDNLGGLTKPSKVLGNYTNNGCWCGESYYTGSDGIGRIVTSTGYNASVWRVVTGNSKPRLVLESSSQAFNDDQNPGFFTSVSSNGTAANSQIVWALTRPSAKNPDAYGIYLQAMDPSNGLKVVYSTEAGTWPFAGTSNANLVPVSANGEVFVTSYGNLSIFGLENQAQHKVSFHAAPSPERVIYPGAPHELYGMVTALHGTSIALQLRGGSQVWVDFTAAKAAGNFAIPSVGHAAMVRGDFDGERNFTAKAFLHLKDSPALWPADR